MLTLHLTVFNILSLREIQEADRFVDLREACCLNTDGRGSTRKNLVNRAYSA
jgi:hypothetical protein